MNIVNFSERLFDIKYEFQYAPKPSNCFAFENNYDHLVGPGEQSLPRVSCSYEIEAIH